MAMSSSTSDLEPNTRTTTSRRRQFNLEDSRAVYALAREPSPLGIKVKDALEIVEKAITEYS